MVIMEEKQPQKNQLAREMKQLDDMATFNRELLFCFEFRSVHACALQLTAYFLFLNSNPKLCRKKRPPKGE